MTSKFDSFCVLCPLLCNKQYIKCEFMKYQVAFVDKNIEFLLFANVAFFQFAYYLCIVSIHWIKLKNKRKENVSLLSFIINFHSVNSIHCACRLEYSPGVRCPDCKGNKIDSTNIV